MQIIYNHKKKQLIVICGTIATMYEGKQALLIYKELVYD